MCGLDLADGRASDHRLGVQHAALPTGSLRLADLGFYDLGVLAALSAQEVYWLSKLEPNALITDTTGRSRSLAGICAERWARLRSGTGAVWVGKGQRLSARLLIQRVPQEVADQRRRRIRKTARDKGVTPSAAALALAEWTILMTNIPPEMLSVAEALVLAKVRWQIELLFKLWKSHGQIDQLAHRASRRGSCVKCTPSCWRWWCSTGRWWSGAGSLPTALWSRLRKWCATMRPSWQVRGHDAERLKEVLETIQQVLARTARMNTRKKHPNTYQLLLALTTEPAQA